MRAQTPAILAQAISARATRVKPMDRRVPQNNFAKVSPFLQGKSGAKMTQRTPSAPAPIRPFRASGFEGEETGGTTTVA